MLGKLSGWNDTIAALSTPQGIGAIGVIRVSGDKAIPIVNALFYKKNLTLVATHTLHVGLLKYKDEIIDEVVIGLYKSPASYTGEDVVEISCHGSPYVQNNILQILSQCGARAAKPGEFTQRAFLNGKLNLAQAEGVADLIASNTAASRRTALQNMRSGFSIILKDVREELLKFSALIELELDFAEEDVEFADRTNLLLLLKDAKEKVAGLLQSFTLGNVIKNGVQVAIIGKPNTGKSTLLNALLNEERAIVSEIAGTTRDTIEETLNINGILFRLIDTAGLREHTSDIIETLGIERSIAKMNSADVVVYVFDVNEVDATELLTLIKPLQEANFTLIIAGNKADEKDEKYLQKSYKTIDDCLFISAKKNTGIDVLKQRLYNAVIAADADISGTIVTNTRHVEALQKVAFYIYEIQQAFINKVPVDLITADIRACLHYIGEITGEVTNEDQLDYIFSKFCIGK